MSARTLPEADLAHEDACLLACARRRMDPSLVELVRDTLVRQEATFDWGRFLDQASRHRVIALTAANLDRYDLMLTDREGVPVIPSQHRWLLDAAYLAVKRRNQAILEELGVITTALSEAGVRVVVRKGGYLTRALYGDVGVRRMSDMDLLVESGEAAAATRERLVELGYVQGDATRNGRRVQPLSRQSQLHWTLNLNSLPPFVRTTSDPYVEQLYIDVRTNLVTASAGVDVSTADIVRHARTIETDGRTMLAPSYEHGLLDLCLHLFREATTIYYIEAGKDLTLMKFCDVAEYLEWSAPHLDQAAFLEDARRYGVLGPVYFALHFTDALYPDVVPRSLLDACRPPDLAFLDEYGAEERQPNRWGGDFVSRLFDPARAGKRVGRSTMPAEPRT